MNQDNRTGPHRPRVVRVSLPPLLSIVLVLPLLALLAGFLAIAAAAFVLGGLLLPLVFQRSRKASDAPQDYIELDRSQYRTVADDERVLSQRDPRGEE